MLTTDCNMLTHEQAEEIFLRLSRYSNADGMEMLIAGGHSALTRFANNTIHQNVEEENYVVSVRTVIGRKTARATTNKLDEASLRRAVESAEAMTEVQVDDPDLLPLAPASMTDGPPTERYFENTAAVTPEDRASAVESIVASPRRTISPPLASSPVRGRWRPL